MRNRAEYMREYRAKLRAAEAATKIDPNEVVPGTATIGDWIQRWGNAQIRIDELEAEVGYLKQQLAVVLSDGTELRATGVDTVIDHSGPETVYRTFRPVPKPKSK